MKYLHLIAVLGILFFISCGSAPSLSDAAILATADAIRARTPLAPSARTPSAFSQTSEAEAADVQAYFDQEDARAAALEIVIEKAMATDDAMLAELTEEAAAWATDDAFVEDIIATDMAWLTEEASDPQQGCPGGCTTYPSWCEPPIKGNVSFDDGERIYHMPGDEYYEQTKINPDYDERYFCTPEEAEATGFRRAYR